MGNFSRDTFNKLKHYVGVRLQQGVPIVDADWNEQEDIRKYELRSFLKWFVGNGVPQGNEGFRILSTAGSNNFTIRGGDGTPDGAGRCLVEGWDVINESDLGYTEQPLYDNADLADAWDVDPLPPLTTPGADRTDTVYLDVWEREVDATEDPDHLVNPAIGLETCVRLKREWVVRVAEGATTPPAPAAGHVFYPLASLARRGGDAVIRTEYITDLRQTGVNLGALEAEIADARGIKANVGNRLDESLTKGGLLRHNVVGNDQVKSDAAIEESKVLFSPSGHDHSGDSQGRPIGTDGLRDDSVTYPKLKFTLVNSGSEADIPPDSTRTPLVEADVALGGGKNKIYMPAISIAGVEGSGVAQVTRELVYRSTASTDNFDVYLSITNLPGGSETVDVIWYVYTFAEE